MVQLRLLGGIQAVTDGGDALDVGSAKCRAVLAALALSVGDAVPVPRLVDVVWAEDPPRTAEKTLQGYIAHLRKVLGPDAIGRTGAAYRLDLDPDHVDVARFRRLLSAGDVDGALATWTGTPLAGLDAPGLDATVDALVEQWLGAVEDRLARQVATDAGRAIAPLTELTAAHPFREQLWALLMTALYRVGRQADALAAFQRAREHLVDELGVEPGPRLREVEAQILAHDEGLQGRAGTSPPSVPSSVRPTGTVTFGFADVADAAQLWAEHHRKMAQTMARLEAVVRTATDRQDGTLLVSSGESFGVAFHRADDAAAWAAELQLAVEREPWPGGVELRLQVALHSGETEEHDGSYFGAAVHTASRLATAAHGGQVLVSDVTAALLERDDLRDLGIHHLEGAGGEHDLWQLDDGDHPPLRSASTRRGNLPRRSARLLGRDAELDTVVEAMAVSPVVTLVGPGGIGKTTLALAAARRSEAEARRRVWLVELAEIAASADVPHTVAETLGVTGGASRSLTESVVAALRSRPTLLVLDNCEHVVDGAASLAQAIADDGADTRVLATSREGLGIPGERLVPVAPLDITQAAVELFAERARAAAGTFELDAARGEVEEICRRLDGLPLAIELAAARSASLTPAQLLARLDDRLRLLGGGRRIGAERHRTLRTTVQWSYDLLTRAQQALFERLAVFAGPFDLTAAEAVAAGGELDTVDVDRLLGDLVERSMVGVEPGVFGRRFRLLETLRQFALEQLAGHGGREQLAARHAGWCRDEVASIGTLLTGHREVEGVARLAELWPNLRVAVDWACSAGFAQLADALVRPIASEVSLRRQVEIGDWAERILELTPPEDEARVMFWLLWAGHRHVQAGDHEAYGALMRRHGHREHAIVRFNDAYLSGVGEDLHTAAPAAVAWLRDQGEDHAADMLEVAGVASSLITLQRFDELDALATTMAERHRRHGPPTLRYFGLGMRGYAAQYQGRHEDAGRLFLEAERVELPAGTYRVIQTVAARSAFEQGDRPRAYRVLRDNIEVLLDSDYTDVTRMVAVEFITMMAGVDRLAEAARLLPYLDTTGDFGTLAREHLIADAVQAIDADPELGDELDADADARGALTFMRDVLDELIADTGTSRRFTPADG